ncbi:glycosyltransferase family 4 protein [Eubacterium limosum]|uniref:glycosyltransferase family 4 protein n=1 Tax=Eubacterium limosum TaxID=1736 RepID=UPI0022E1DA48|nr:glycosyltransferase family 4 protein [Eubacterium limosum]
MNILVVSQYYYPEPFRVHEVCEGLVTMGHKVTVLTTFPNYPEGEIYDGYENQRERIEIINGVEVRRYYTIPRHSGAKYLIFSYLSYAFIISKIIKTLDKNFDCVYVYQMSPVLMAIPAIKYKKLNKVPMYLYCLDIWPESIKTHILNEKNILYRLIKKISSHIYQKADCIGITSRAFCKYLVEECGVDINRISYLPQHAMDIGVCNKKNNSDHTALFFTGNIGKDQNIDLIIDAVDKIRNIPGYTVEFVGSGSRLEYAKKKVKDLMLDNIIIFHGRFPASRMPEFYEKADACLLTLCGDSLIGMTIPGKMQGYMSAGKIIIGAIEGDAAKIIRESNCGIVVSSNDVNGFSEGLKLFITHKEQFKRCGINARKYYEQHFTIEQHLESLEISLNNLNGGKYS